MVVVISIVVVDACRGRDRACGPVQFPPLTPPGEVDPVDACPVAAGLAADAVAGFVDRPDAIVAWPPVSTVAALAGIKLVRSRAAA
jgi:hypothetical protein